jgi:predicted nuclease of predicted toxin-antitoxin system
VIAFYFDEHLDRDIARLMVKNGYEVVMAVDVGMTARPDEEHLDYATERNLVMVTFDHPFAGRTNTRTDFFGLLCLPNYMSQDIGGVAELLAEFAQLFDPEQDKGQVFWMP